MAVCELRISWSVIDPDPKEMLVESWILNSLLLHVLPLEDISISYIILQILFTRESGPIHNF